MQRSMLSIWLSGDDSIETVRKRIAAPPPEGFGMNACATTLRRLKHLFENTRVTTSVSDAMDTACDLLDSRDAGDVAPLREALSLMLYSRAVEAAQQGANPEILDKLLGVITKIEKLKTPPARPRPRSEPPPPAATRHYVELSAATVPPKIVQVTATPIPPNASDNPGSGDTIAD
jgi:hypothetical protein